MLSVSGTQNIENADRNMQGHIQYAGCRSPGEGKSLNGPFRKKNGLAMKKIYDCFVKAEEAIACLLLAGIVALMFPVILIVGIRLGIMTPVESGRLRLSTRSLSDFSCTGN